MSLSPGPGAPPVPAVCLVILDGWGLAAAGAGNAVELADTPNFDELWGHHPHATLVTCGRAVGLPEGQMGNSEVGHLNLGAGAVVPQDLTRIGMEIEDGSLQDNRVLLDACRAGKETGRLHLLGLVSDGGVHSSIEHLRALIELAAREGVPDIVLHAFTDGRDTLPTSGADHLKQAEQWLGANGGRVASVSGRYHAMDRDRRWERTKSAYDALVHGRSTLVPAPSGEQAVRDAYERGETDEFVQPTLVGDEGLIRDGDPALFFNFRPDRARQLSRALSEQGFEEFDRGEAPSVALTTLTEYQDDFPYPVAYEPARPKVTLAGVLAEHGVAQLHVAETEKYAHVTYFFNGGEEDPHAREERFLADSPRDVATYDQKPEMSAEAATDGFLARWSEGRFGFAIINFANPDMVGHTGAIEAAVTAIETVDGCLDRVVKAVHGAGGACVITADHGNAEQMLEPDGSPNTAHSLNPVPVIVTARVEAVRDGGVLGDVAPTVLELLGLDQPAQMTGRSLLVE